MACIALGLANVDRGSRALLTGGWMLALTRFLLVLDAATVGFDEALPCGVAPTNKLGQLLPRQNSSEPTSNYWTVFHIGSTYKKSRHDSTNLLS